jgi:WD40 repeat protein
MSYILILLLNLAVKGVNFFGPKSEYIISGSDCSNVFLWEKESERIVQYFEADVGGVINVLEPHPTGPFLATSGLDSDVKIWAPTAEETTKLDGLRHVSVFPLLRPVKSFNISQFGFWDQVRSKKLH